MEYRLTNQDLVLVWLEIAPEDKRYTIKENYKQVYKLREETN